MKMKPKTKEKNDKKLNTKRININRREDYQG